MPVSPINVHEAKRVTGPDIATNALDAIFPDKYTWLPLKETAPKGAVSLPRLFRSRAPAEVAFKVKVGATLPFATVTGFVKIRPSTPAEFILISVDIVIGESILMDELEYTSPPKIRLDALIVRTPKGLAELPKDGIVKG